MGLRPEVLESFSHEMWVPQSHQDSALLVKGTPEKNTDPLWAGL